MKAGKHELTLQRRLKATDNYYISGYPTTYVVDKEGYVNAMNEEMLEKLISMYR